MVAVAAGSGKPAEENGTKEFDPLLVCLLLLAWNGSGSGWGGLERRFSSKDTRIRSRSVYGNEVAER
jgi:hypothetical protein